MKLKATALILAIGAWAGVAGHPKTQPVDNANARPWNEIYIWQRSWADRVARSVTANADLVGGWRVLALEISPEGQQFASNPDFDVLARTGLPVTAVVRIDGRADRIDGQAVASSVSDVARRWNEAGMRVSVEIDFDCATSQLGTYSDVLARTRSALPKGIRLSITALPTWMNSPALAKVVAIPDEIVLQVHAVRDPRFGLFDPMAAKEWVKRFAAISPTPFRVALPTYGARVTMSGEKVAAVESEIDGFSGGGGAFEISADPLAVSDFARELHEYRSDGFVGVVWFRLPVDGDKRAWSAATWRSVVSGEPRTYRAQLDVEAQPNGAKFLILKNESGVDALAPRWISLPSDCPSDGANGFEIEQDPGETRLVRTQQTLLRASERRVIGWTRCQVDKGILHVED